MTIALLLERCRPGTTLQALPEAEQDPIVAGLLRRLWRQPAPGHRFRSLSSVCERGPRSSSKRLLNTRAALTRACAGRGSNYSGSCRSTRNTRCCCAPTCMPATYLPPSGSHGCSSTPSPTSATPPMTLSSTCSTATSVCTPSPIGCWPASLTCLNSTPSPYAVVVRSLRPEVNHLAGTRRGGPVSGARLATAGSGFMRGSGHGS